MTNERHEKALEAACAVHPMYMRPEIVEAMFAAYLQAMGAVIVPKEPDNEMLDGARHLIMWMDFDRPTEQELISHCKRLGKDAPVSCRDVDHVPPKALRTFWIYQAMLSKAPNHFTNGE